MRKVTVKVPNPAVAPTNLNSEFLNFRSLLNETASLDARLFVLPEGSTSLSAAPGTASGSTRNTMDVS